jgi:hypothetical protein
LSHHKSPSPIIAVAIVDKAAHPGIALIAVKKPPSTTAGSANQGPTKGSIKAIFFTSFGRIVYVADNFLHSVSDLQVVKIAIHSRYILQ